MDVWMDNVDSAGARKSLEAAAKKLIEFDSDYMTKKSLVSAIYMRVYV